ncbi:purine-cytosine permease family protein [Kibdelosporangium phytohabitans]|uniref:Cytosine permease n=1 Tax=Kibdelosporangium phytohabitans TaxID=860235 RepID=A0A0N7F581_9PSEU|nr:cytosine permease [Kibdelosporangium phytohabitans]ALG13495.1 cytosine permease [Kibdelosporangium phytohabitans]MBE1465345.1 NCS1 nucleoside transporter family [Kibdelosporangium phytohabitans]
MYGEKVVKVEPGGIEPVAEADKHGRPRQLFWTWTSPNLEFATIFLGVLAVSAFGLGFWQAAAALTLGNLLGATAHGMLSARGLTYGVPQMVLGRVAFGFWGNVLPATLMSVMAGAGWFAVNSVSGAFALNSLTTMPLLLCLAIVVLLQVVIAFFGHNLVQAFERYAFPVLAVVFAITAVVIFSKASPGNSSGTGGPGGFLLAASAAFGYTAGWNPYAADYTRYLPTGTSRRAVGWSAGSGLFLATTVLMLVGAASATIGGSTSDNPATVFTGHLPGWLAALTLLSITLGSMAANVLNVYSAALAFLTLGVKLPLAWRRAVVAVGFGVIGFVLAWLGLADAGHAFESFLLVIAYWIGPWLGVTLVDQHIRRDQRFGHVLDDTSHRNRAGPVALLAGMIVSIGLFANQARYRGPVPEAIPWIGDVTFLVGFAISAVVYAVWRKPASPSP